jgi:hypothetical protein
MEQAKTLREFSAAFGLGGHFKTGQ